jgi:hypothetical protein
MSGIASQNNAGQTSNVPRVDAVLTKPFTVQQILSVLDNLHNVDKEKAGK